MGKSYWAKIPNGNRQIRVIKLRLSKILFLKIGLSNGNKQQTEGLIRDRANIP
jgi:hypothetical protein